MGKRKWLIPLSIASVMLFSGIAFAEGRYKMIEVFFERINVAVNGEFLPLTQDTIIYNGSVYMPLRNLSEMLGATVSWNDQTHSVNLDFISYNKSLLSDASNKGLYQYIAIQNNIVMAQILDRFKNGDMEGMKQDLERFTELRKIAAGMKNDAMTAAFDKIQASGELLRSGWASKNLDNYSIGWTIFNTNAQSVADLLKKELADGVVGSSK